MPTLNKPPTQPDRSAAGQPQPPARAQAEITMQEHLRVQREIEGHAYRFWLAAGRGQQGALADWLKAEEEVLSEFVKKRMQFQEQRPASGKATSLAGEMRSWRPEIRRPPHFTNWMNA